MLTQRAPRAKQAPVRRTERKRPPQLPARALPRGVVVGRAARIARRATPQCRLVLCRVASWSHTPRALRRALRGASCLRLRGSYARLSTEPSLPSVFSHSSANALVQETRWRAGRVRMCREHLAMRPRAALRLAGSSFVALGINSGGVHASRPPMCARRVHQLTAPLEQAGVHAQQRLAELPGSRARERERRAQPRVSHSIPTPNPNPPGSANARAKPARRERARTAHSARAQTRERNNLSPHRSRRRRHSTGRGARARADAERNAEREDNKHTRHKTRAPPPPAGARSSAVHARGTAARGGDGVGRSMGGERAPSSDRPRPRRQDTARTIEVATAAGRGHVWGDR